MPIREFHIWHIGYTDSHAQPSHILTSIFGNKFVYNYQVYQPNTVKNEWNLRQLLNDQQFTPIYGICQSESFQYVTIFPLAIMRSLQISYPQFFGVSLNIISHYMCQIRWGSQCRQQYYCSFINSKYSWNYWIFICLVICSVSIFPFENYSCCLL